MKFQMEVQCVEGAQRGENVCLRKIHVEVFVEMYYEGGLKSVRPQHEDSSTRK